VIECWIRYFQLWGFFMSRHHVHSGLTRGAASIELLERLFTAPQATKSIVPNMAPQLAQLAQYHRLAEGSLDVLRENSWLQKPLQVLADNPATQARVGKLSPIYDGVELTLKTSVARKDVARVELRPDGAMRVRRHPESDALKTAIKALESAAPTKPQATKNQAGVNPKHQR